LEARIYKVQTTSAPEEGKLVDDAVADLDRQDLRDLTVEMVDSMLKLLESCVDDLVTFVPVDPEAYDPAASDESEVDLAWTLGHVIVHVTASAEEAAFLAAEMARGVPHREGRSRFEVPWREVRTIEQCRQRLEESRRMRLASLDMWPDEPHLDNTTLDWRGKSINAVTRFLFGLRHDASHFSQIENIIRQAKTGQV
jgi:hypothetical protein